VYGYVTAKRSVAPKGLSRSERAPAMSTYIDAVVALVPAEALAFYGAVVAPNVTGTVDVQGTTAVTVNDATTMSWSCLALLVLSSALYLTGRWKKESPLTWWDIPRILIPAAAFAAWMLLATPSVWHVWLPGTTTSAHLVWAAFAAIGLSVGAIVLGYQVDRADPG
jgi:hypothetical protein